MGMAALPSSTLPARGGAVGRLPHRPRHRSVILVWYARRRLRRDRVGDRIAVFSFYLANFADRGLTYGSLGTAVGLLVYLYLSASVVLLGAEINAAIWQSVPDMAEQTEYQASDDEAAETHRTGKNVQGGEDGR